MNEWALKTNSSVYFSKWVRDFAQSSNGSPLKELFNP